MKYFTPALHELNCSANDAVANADHAEWEAALERYEKRLKKIRPVLTSGARSLAERLRLHDAQLLYVGRSDDRCFLALQTQQSPASIVSLEYSLAANPIVQGNQFSKELQTTACCFLYDEVDLTARDDRPIFTHSILFTNGLHIRIKFHDVNVRIVDPLVQVPPPSSNVGLAQPA